MTFVFLCVGNPGSNASPNPSPASGVRKPAEEHAYMEKLKQLSKYREPLRRMINKIDKDEGSTGQPEAIYRIRPNYRPCPHNPPPLIF